MRKYLLGLFLTLPLSGQATDYVTSPEYFQVKKVQLEEVTATGLKRVSSVNLDEASQNQNPNDPIAKGERIVALIRDIVALGEEIYEIVNRGRPSVTTDSAPISVLPYVNGAPVNMFEMENWSAPVSKKYKLVYKNGFNQSVVVFEYTVLYTYAGSFNGKGKYLTAVQIIPSQISVKYGFTFDAKFKLQSIQNHGTKESPVAGATLIMNYKVSSLVSAEDTSDSFHINGNGNFTVL
jgi:hypothetical protein